LLGYCLQLFSSYDAFVGTMPAHKEKGMSKLPAGQINPANLWGKPMPTLSTRITSRGGKSADSELDEIAEPNDDELAAEEDAYEDESAEDVRETSKKLTRQEVEAVDDDPDDAEEEENEDESDIAPEDGDDDVDLLSDKSSSTVADEIDDDVNEGVTTMAEKKSGADHIRDEINKRQADGDSLRGVDIVAALAKKKVTVSAAQVSQLLKAAGASAARGPRAEKGAATEEKSRMAAKGKKQTAAPAAPTGRSAMQVAKPMAAGAAGMPMAQLEAAAAFLDTCNGCYDTATEILATHHRLGQMYGRVSK
jgi:hypothetical protein